MNKLHINRRNLLKAGLALSIAPSVGWSKQMVMTRPIPVSGEQLPIIGLGTWKTFDVRGWWWEISARRAVVDLMIERGASVIDTSPKYGRSEEIVGEVLSTDNRRAKMFLANKVWTDGKENGTAQILESARRKQADKIDLMMVHDQRDMQTQMAVIRDFQKAGLIRYNGISEWQAGAYGDLESSVNKYKPQFIQINYSLGEREAEQRILPMARDLGSAVMINRPFMSGKLFRAVGERPLPPWASGFAESWGQFFLKFILSHDAVTCVIPGTSEVRHMDDNLSAGVGNIPDAAMRARMVSYFDSL